MSGSDVQFMVLCVLTRFWEAAFGMELSCEHMFSVDIDERRRKFILERIKPKHLYSDVLELAVNSREPR
eukprot:2538526-Lingulodinium_polyedra.AAC.1